MYVHVHVALVSVRAGVQMSDFKVGNSMEMNNYPNLDVEEANIQEAIAQFYGFFGLMVRLRNDIELLALDDVTKNRILDQLGDIESESLILMCFGVCECTFVCIFAASLAECLCVCVPMIHTVRCLLTTSTCM